MPGGNILGKCFKCCEEAFRCDSITGNGSLCGWSKPEAQNEGDLNRRKFQKWTFEEHLESCHISTDHPDVCPGDPGWCSGGNKRDIPPTSVAFSDCAPPTDAQRLTPYTNFGRNCRQNCTEFDFSQALSKDITNLPPEPSPSPVATSETTWLWSVEFDCFHSSVNVVTSSFIILVELSEPDTVAAALARANNLADVTGDSSNDELTKSGHQLSTGQKLRFEEGVGFGGLEVGSTYWVITLSPAIFKLAKSASDATAGIAIDLASSGSAGKFTRLGSSCRTHAGTSVGSTSKLSETPISISGSTSVEAVKQFTGLTASVEYMVTVLLKRYEPDTTTPIVGGDEVVDLFFTPAAPDGELRFDVPVEEDADVVVVGMSDPVAA